MHSLVTGITGFVGGHLAERLLEEGERVSGLARAAAWPRALAHLAGRAELVACDLTDRAAVAACLHRLNPDRVFHLAAQANVPASLDDPERTWRVNLDGTRHLLEAVRALGRPVRVLVVASAAVYGPVPPQAQPITEEQPLRPASPYAASKAAADLVACQYALGYGLDVIRVRPFNHTGPRQSPDYVASHFAMQIAAIERGRRPPCLKTGNLAVRRDISDVRDVVRAYRLLMDRGARGEVYHVASGRAPAVQELLDILLARTSAPIRVEPDPALVRPADAPLMVGDASRLRAATGWEPQIPLETTLADLLEWWRQQD